jgi:hypothetical protein
VGKSIVAPLFNHQNVGHKQHARSTGLALQFLNVNNKWISSVGAVFDFIEVWGVNIKFQKDAVLSYD